LFEELSYAIKDKLETNALKLWGGVVGEKIKNKEKNGSIGRDGRRGKGKKKSCQPRDTRKMQTGFLRAGRAGGPNPFENNQSRSGAEN